jgi:hypothetical protein
LHECHGIERSENALRSCFYRFELLIEQVHTIIETLIHDYFAEQQVTFAKFDEAFYNSLYNSKLCLGVLLLPETRVIAGISVSKDHNQETIENIFSEFKEYAGNLDVLGVDLASMYTRPISSVFTAISLQYCVFHFFQILFRNVVNPFANEVRKLLKEELKTFKTKFESSFRSLHKQVHGKLTGLLEDIETRFNFCLKKRYPNYLVSEFEIFITELQKSLTEAEQSSNLHSIQSPEHNLVTGLDAIIGMSKSFIRKLKTIPSLREFQEVYEVMDQLKTLFQCTEENQFNTLLQELEQTCTTSESTHKQELFSYLKKYQSNLTTYLQTGVSKTTSLLEQVNQRMKKNTKNNRGAQYETTMKSYSSMYQFFWNTEPVQLRSETKSVQKSPIARLTEGTKTKDDSDFTVQWWTWLQPLSYHEYRKRVRLENEKRKSESQLVINKRKRTTTETKRTPY